MNLQIDTSLRGNISKITKDRLTVLVDLLEGEDVLPRDTLIAIGKELVEGDKDTMDKQNLERMVYMLEANKPVSVRQVQSVFSDYVARAAEGKRGGRYSRKSRRNSRKSRSSRNSSRNRNVKK